MRRAALLGVLWIAACGDPSPELRLKVRLPVDQRLLRSVTRFDLSAQRDGRVIAQHSMPGDVDFVSVSGVPRGPRTTFVLEGLTDAGDVVGHGASCPVDYQGPGPEVALYFSPVNFFAPASDPIETRALPLALPLADGSVLIGGGLVGGAARASVERFTPAGATFVQEPSLALAMPRARAEIALLADGTALVTGGVGADGQPLGDAEVWSPRAGQFVPLSNQGLGVRVGHTATSLPDGRILIAGGVDASGVALSSATLVRLLDDATATLQPVMPMITARTQHAAVVDDGGIPMVIGGYDAAGAALSSIEALRPAVGGAKPEFRKVGDLRSARAEATATVVKGGILVVGGMGQPGKPADDPCFGGLCRDAELYSLTLQEATSLPLATARRGHRATPLSGGRVLITGGIGAAGEPLSSVELYVPDIGFVSERPLGTPRAGHVAVPLCDGTVLVVGGGAGAEIYTPPVN